MMDTLATLAAAVRANPDDDTPRLVYADCLDERGDYAVTEFVRLQCRLARLGPHVTRDVQPDRVALERRERDLWTIIGDWYKTDLPSGWVVAIEQGRHRREHTGQYAFVTRGFVSVISCPLSSWIAFGPTLVRRHPIERVVPYDHMPVYVEAEPDDTLVGYEDEPAGEWTVWLVATSIHAGWAEVCEEHYPGPDTAKNERYLREYQSNSLIAWAKAHPGGAAP